MQDEMEKSTFETMKKLFFKVIGGTFKVGKGLALKIQKDIKPHKMKGTKALLKNNKGSGIHIEKGLDKKLAKALEKELIRHNQDYVIEEKDGKYNITVIANNKTLVDELKDKCLDSAYKTKKTFKADLNVFKKQAKIERAKSIERMQERTNPIKHRSIDNR